MEMSKYKKQLKKQFRYNPLWKLLIDRDIKKKELKEISEVSVVSIAKMAKCENVTNDFFFRICEVRDCQLLDIVERVKK